MKTMTKTLLPLVLLTLTANAGFGQPAKDQKPKGSKNINEKAAAQAPQRQMGGEPAKPVALTLEDLKPFLRPLITLKTSQNRLVVDRTRWQNTLDNPPGHPYAGKVKPPKKEEVQDITDKEGNKIRTKTSRPWPYPSTADTPLKKVFHKLGLACGSQMINACDTTVASKKSNTIKRKIYNRETKSYVEKEMPNWKGPDNRWAFFAASEMQAYLFEDQGYFKLTLTERTGEMRTLTLEDNGKGALRLYLSKGKNADTLFINQRATGTIEVIRFGPQGLTAFQVPSFSQVTARNDWKTAADLLSAFGFALPTSQATGAAPGATALPHTLKGIAPLAPGLHKFLKLYPDQGTLSLSNTHINKTKLLAVKEPVDTYKPENMRPKLKHLGARRYPKGNNIYSHFTRLGMAYFQFTPRSEMYKKRQWNSGEPNLLVRTFQEKGLYGRLTYSLSVGLTGALANMPGAPHKGYESEHIPKLPYAELILDEQHLMGDYLYARCSRLHDHRRYVMVNTKENHTIMIEQFEDRRIFAVSLKDHKTLFAAEGKDFKQLYTQQLSAMEEKIFGPLQTLGLGHFDIYGKATKRAAWSQIAQISKEEKEEVLELIDMLGSENQDERSEALEALTQDFVRYRLVLEENLKNPSLGTEAAEHLKNILSTETKKLASGEQLCKSLDLVSNLDYLIFLLGQSEPELKKDAKRQLENITGQQCGEDPEAWKTWIKTKDK